MRNTSTILQNIFIHGYSHGGSSFEQLMCLDTTIVSLFFTKKKIKIKKNQKKKEEEKKKKKKKIQKKKEREKEKERGDIHNQSINHWCLTHLSRISEGLYS